MGTELELVYSILETVNKGILSDDDKIDERVVRSFVRTYRASSIAKYSMQGFTISDECFQYLGLVPFTFLKDKHFSFTAPKIIRLKDNFGIQVSKNGINIPLVNSEAFDLSLKNVINGNLPKGKFLSNKATIFIGKKITTTCGEKPSANEAIDDFENDLIESEGQQIFVDVYAVLEDPDDAPGYDWTKDSFPCPSELVEEIKKRIFTTEFQITLYAKPDNNTDGKQVEENESNRP